MANKVLSDAEAVEYEEFRRTRRETEISLTLRRLVVDASAREIDRSALNGACDLARKLQATAVNVSPVNVSAARRRLGESENVSGGLICCVVGGTGESLTAVKKTEAKRAVRQGAKMIRLVPCYSALTGANAAYLKREVKKVKRAVKKCALILSLDDGALGAEELERGIRAALDGKADGISVRGETETLDLAVRLSAGRLPIEASGVENAEQLRLLLKAGAERALTPCAERIASGLRQAMTEEREKDREKSSPSQTSDGE